MEEVELREVADGDLEALFEHQLDEEAAAMAGFPSRERDAFVAHWARIRADPAVVTRSILAGGSLAGSLAVFPDVGKRAVGYWIGKDFWGRGIATAALGRFLDGYEERPLHAWVLASNAASKRVLEKCGFKPASDARVEPGEVLYRLD
ncbi:MAG: GNAT family N-acetyltransferase [Gaiellaceae bacterium]